MKRILLLAPLVRFAMQPYVLETCKALTAKCEIFLLTLSRVDNDREFIRTKSLGAGQSRVSKFIALFMPSTYYRMWKELSTFRPDVVHILNGEGFPCSIALSIMAQVKRIPLVVTVHDPIPHPGNFLELLNFRLSKFTLSNASRVHVHKSQQSREIVKKGVAANKVAVIPHGNFASRYLRYADKNIKKENIILFFGRIESYKGLDVLLNSIDTIPSKWKVSIAGPGLITPRQQIIISAHRERVELINRYLSDSEVCHLFQRSRILVLPYTQVTQSSLPSIGAAYGLMIVSSDLDGLKEEVCSLGGVVFRSGSSEELASAITSITNLGEIAPHSVVGTSFTDVADAMTNMYDELDTLQTH
jgi:glycosyltransferase involved in cell wall biosynthesis